MPAHKNKSIITTSIYSIAIIKWVCAFMPRKLWKWQHLQDVRFIKGDVGKHPEAPHPPRMQVGEVFVRFCVLKGFFFFCWSLHRKKKSTTGKQNLQWIPLRGWLWLGLTNGAGIKHSTAEAESSALPQVDSASADLPVGARTTSACLKHAYGGPRFLRACSYSWIPYSDT